MNTGKVIPLHRVSQVPYTVDGPYTRDSDEQREPMTNLERLAVVLIFAASTAIVFMVLGWGFEELKRFDWSVIAERLGVRG